MLSLTDGQQIVLTRINNYDITRLRYFVFDKEIALPSTITIKQNILVELYVGNYNINDGLVNGTECIFRFYSSNNNKPDIWIEFSDIEIRKQQRNEFKVLYEIHILPSYTPIF